jgi:hypothetical protein
MKKLSLRLVAADPSGLPSANTTGVLGKGGNHMRKFRALAIALACCTVGGFGGAVVANASTGTPEIDRANATIKSSGTLRPVRCVGEDGFPYVTYFGAWKGAENQLPPDATDYAPLSGPWTVTGITWTINMKTLRGALTAAVSLVNAAGAVDYKGKLLLVTQGLPSATAQALARGVVSAGFVPPDESVTANDDSLLANIEMKIGPSGGSGQFGDVPGSLGIADYSVVTNVAPNALDGVC